MGRDTTSTAALDFLLRAAENGFRDAWDLRTNFRGTPLVMGTVFPLSLIGIVLARPELGEASRRVAQSEAETIASLVDDSGWRYFNLYPAIPPDIDDFGSAARLLHALSWPGLDALLAPALQLVRHNAHPEGGFRNWLVEDLTQAEAIGKLWVEGPDPRHVESTANLVEALCRVAPDAFEAELRRSAEWLVGWLQPDGWRSWWYYGWGYGTMMVIRALRAIATRFPDLDAPLAEACRTAARGLVAAQHPDGAWSPRVSALSHPDLAADWLRPSPQETAFAVSALAALGPWAPDGTRDAIRRGADFLRETQAEDGGWTAEPLYLTLGMSAYASRPVTAAFALDALLAASQIDKN